MKYPILLKSALQAFLVMFLKFIVAACNLPLYHSRMKLKPKPINPQSAALIHAINLSGGQSSLARHLKIKPQAVQQWLKNGVPVKRVIAIELFTGVTRKSLRPDIYQ